MWLAVASSERIPVLQVLRAAAALMVAQTHVVAIQGVHEIGKASQRVWQPAWQASFHEFPALGAVGVDLFFVVSGFIVPLTAMRPGATRLGFLEKRALRVYPLWLYMVAIAALGKLARGEFEWFNIAWSALLLPTFDPHWTPIIFMGWSLVFEVFFYCLIAVVWGTRERVLAVLVVLVAIGKLVPGLPLAHLVSNPMLMEFEFGLLLGMGWKRGVRVPWPALPVAVGVALLAWSGMSGANALSSVEATVSGEVASQRVLHWGVPAALIVAGCLWLRPRCESRAGRFFTAIGDASYSIYAMSFFAQMALNKAWGLFAWLPGDVAILLGTAAMTAIGYLTYLYAERPLLRGLQTRIATLVLT